MLLVAQPYATRSRPPALDLPLSPFPGASLQSSLFPSVLFSCSCRLSFSSTLFPCSRWACISTLTLFAPPRSLLLSSHHRADRFRRKSAFCRPQDFLPSLLYRLGVGPGPRRSAWSQCSVPSACVHDSATVAHGAACAYKAAWPPSWPFSVLGVPFILFSFLLFVLGFLLLPSPPFFFTSFIYPYLFDCRFKTDELRHSALPHPSSHRPLKW